VRVSEQKKLDHTVSQSRPLYGAPTDGRLCRR
jgi:hypothetical protein